MKDAYTAAWLPYLSAEAPAGATAFEVAKAEIKEGLRALGHPFDIELAVKADMPREAYTLSCDQGTVRVCGGGTGVLYGVYDALERAALGERPEAGDFSPQYKLRMLNHWDNMDGSVERGYAGRSLFFEDGRFAFDEGRIRQYGRMLASLHINVISVNNVNVRAPADKLITEEFLPDVKRLADILRPYGVRLLLSIDFASPVSAGLKTADPMDESVRAWWKKQTALVYSYVPDLCGYLVKADSEFRPGPASYGRDHAQGANLLAEALAPFGGTVVWRCFVYNCRQDWRDKTQDRPKAAYENYAPLDGEFMENVLLQIKNGPLDFQVREPLSPLFYGMKRTRKALEMQLTQEYTGQQIDLYFMQEVFGEIFGALPEGAVDSVAAVANTGRDESWCGHDLACANLYAYGKSTYFTPPDPLNTARDFLRLCYGRENPAVETLSRLMVKSRGVYEKYACPLGIGFMVNPNHHYGPSPEGYEYAAWGTYHRADREAVGVDRTLSGTGYTAQYPRDIAKIYENPAACPEKLLLFFHRLRYDFVMRDGRTLIQRIYDDHFEGAREAEEMRAAFESVRAFLPEKAAERMAERFSAQVKNAREWRDVINTYIHRLSGAPDREGRKIYD